MVFREVAVVAALAALAALACACARRDAVRDAGAAPDQQTVTLRVHAVDPDGAKPLACKLTITAEPAAATPRFGTADQAGRWLSATAFGVGNVAYADPCDVRLPLPAARVTITASAGLERELDTATRELGDEPEPALELRLPRAVDTTGYACADFHVHSAPSFDSDVPIDQRLISALAEGLDALAPTDHEAVGDFDGELLRLGLQGRLALIVGAEVTPDIWPEPQALGHVNLLPVPDGFAPEAHQLPYQTPSALLARLDELYPDALLHVNHPRWDHFIGYLDALAFDPKDPSLDARMGFSHLDAIELWNTHELDVTGGTLLEDILPDYFALLGLGFAPVATGNSDTHGLSHQPLGYPRNCIAVPDDAPEALTPEMITDGVREGALFVTSGPWLEVSVDGHGPGSVVAAADTATLQVLIDAASWVPVDRLRVFQNGALVIDQPVRQLPSQLQLPLTLGAQLTHVMVVVDGLAPLPEAAGTPNAPNRSLAFTNPIWLTRS